uniref:Transporter n=1 Tax=Desulfobacca acetoxidans TaxID=60893 RepID=A0A7V4LCZ6_9BACT
MRRCNLFWFFLIMVLVLMGMPGPGGLMPAWAAEEKAPPAVQEGNGGEKAEAKEEKKEEECPATFGPIITDTAVPIDKGKFALQPTFGLAFITHNFSPSWRRISPGGSFRSFGMDWKFTYGLWDNLEAFVVLPFVYNWAGGVVASGPRGERSASFTGLGDVNLTLKYRLVEESAALPTVTALFATDFPTGRYRRLNPGLLGVDEVGGGAYVFTTGLNMSKYIKPFIFYGNLWYSLGTAFRNDEGRQYPRDFVTVNLAAELPLTGKWVALLELTSFWDGGRLFGHKANVAPAALMSILPGIEYMATDKFSLAFGVNIDLIGKNGEAAVTPLLSMVYCF